MQVSFVRNTHYAFTVGKDKLLKYWDCDKFQELLELSGHHGEVWCLTVSMHGDFVVTGGHDRSIRRWERTDEAFFLDEEKEKKLEALADAGLEDDVAQVREMKRATLNLYHFAHSHKYHTLAMTGFPQSSKEHDFYAVQDLRMRAFLAVLAF